MGLLLTVPQSDRTRLKEVGVSLGSEIGSGCNGKVYSASIERQSALRFGVTYTRVAVKLINIKERLGDNAPPNHARVTMDRVDQEKTVMMKLNHRNVVTSYMVVNIGGESVVRYETKESPQQESVQMVFDRVYVVMEYCDRGTLHNFISGSITEQMGRSLIRDMVNGLHYIHNESIAHGDIHAGNVLLFTDTQTNQTVAKWADFGMNAINITDRTRFLKDICKLAKVTRDTINAIKFKNKSDFDLAFDMMMSMERVPNCDISQVLAHQWFHRQ